jgi:hypothetical protein
LYSRAELALRGSPGLSFAIDYPPKPKRATKDVVE